MKKITILLLVALTFNTAKAQKIGLYNSGTLTDVQDNPAFEAFRDTLNYFAFNLPVYPTLNLDFRLVGFGQTQILNAIYGDNEVDFASLLSNPFAQNHFRLNLDYDLLGFIVSTNKSNNGEFGANVKLRSANNFSFQNNLLGFPGGTDGYGGDTAVNIFNTDFYTLNYAEFAVSYRMDVTSKLGLGMKLGMVKGINYAQVKIDKSHAYFGNEANGYEVDLAAQGAVRFGGVDLLDPNFQDNLLDGAGANNLGYTFSAGATYELNQKINLQAGVRDLGKITWDVGNRTYVLNDTIHFEGADYNNDGSIDSLLTNLEDLIVDTLDDVFTTNLNSSFQLSGSYKWNKWITSTVILHKFVYTPSYRVHLVQDFRVLRALHLVFNAGIGYNNYSQIGANLLIRSKHFDFFVGSERIGNLAVSEASPGLSLNTGLAFRLGVRNPKKKHEKELEKREKELEKRQKEMKKIQEKALERELLEGGQMIPEQETGTGETSDDDGGDQ